MEENHKSSMYIFICILVLIGVILGFASRSNAWSIYKFRVQNIELYSGEEVIDHIYYVTSQPKCTMKSKRLSELQARNIILVTSLTRTTDKMAAEPDTLFYSRRITDDWKKAMKIRKVLYGIMEFIDPYVQKAGAATVTYHAELDFIAVSLHNNFNRCKKLYEDLAKALNDGRTAMMSEGKYTPDAEKRALAESFCTR